MRKITISPVTRANSVGAVTVYVDDKKVINAFSEGTIFRGFEKIMEGRNPWDAPYFTQRICGICSSAHALSSCKALESIAGVEVPRNGILLRNLIYGLDLLQSHIRQFYLLYLWDWVSPPEGHPFKGGYTEDYRLSYKDSTMLRNNYWQAVECGRLAHETLAILGGKVPHNHGIIPGGVSFLPKYDERMEILKRVVQLKDFVENRYLPDTLLLKEKYPDYCEIGGRSSNYLSFGLFSTADNEENTGYISAAVLEGGKRGMDLNEIKESKSYSWYSGEEEYPHEGDTTPDVLREKAYSWIKAPRYSDLSCEGGPFARQQINGNEKTGSRSSVMGRIVARASETLKVAHLLDKWLMELSPDDPYRTSFQLPRNGRGIGITDAMRGPLSHWVTVQRGRISKYQIITPSAWNFSPRDTLDQLGPVEEALLDTPVENQNEPIEIGRVIRSFDPCYACSAHIMNVKGENYKTLEIIP